MPSTRRMPKTYRARRLEPGRAIAIDGRGGDPLWQRAEVLSDFSFPWLDRAAPATEFRAVWNEHHFFFRFDVSDGDVVLAAGADAMEKVIGSDRVEIFFTTEITLNPYYALEIDPRGEVLDYQARFHRQMNWDWSCEGLEIATSRTELGYMVEGSLARSTLEQLGCLHRDETAYLLAGLYRAEFSHAASGDAVIENWISWVDPEVPSPDFHLPASFGKICWVE